MSLRLIPVLLLAAAPLAAQVNLQNLLSNPPFGQARGPAGAEAAGAAWEFRGVAEEGGETWYSLFDAASKRSVWVREGQTPPGLRLRGFNRESLSLTIEHNSQTLTLPLKRAPQVALPPAPLPVPGPGGAGPTPANAGSVPSPALQAGATIDPQVRQRFEEEIRRRRALRQQAVQNAQPTGNP